VTVAAVAVPLIWLHDVSPSKNEPYCPRSDIKNAIHVSDLLRCIGGSAKLADHIWPEYA